MAYLKGTLYWGNLYNQNFPSETATDNALNELIFFCTANHLCIEKDLWNQSFMFYARAGDVFFPLLLILSSFYFFVLLAVNSKILAF